MILIWFKIIRGLNNLLSIRNELLYSEMRKSNFILKYKSHSGQGKIQAYFGKKMSLMEFMAHQL